MFRIVKKGGFKRATALAVSLLCAFTLAGCKPTDFFTDIIITPFSDTIDESNDNYLVFNSPDAEEESPTVTALQWTEESLRSETVNNLVVYSSNPNTDMTAHHSLFDLEPLLPGIEASDGVRLVYDDSSSLDHEAEASDEDQQIEAQSQSIGGRVSSEGGLSQSQEGETDQLSQTGSQSDNQTGGGQAGSDPNGSGGDNGGNDDSPDDKDPGTGNDPFEGYDGVVPQYNPGDAFSKVNRVDHLAVIGQSAAVMAQAIGGPGALSATTEDACNGRKDSRGEWTTSLRDVFGSELAGCQVLWSGDGSSSNTLVSVDALVESCGESGVILYDQRVGNQGSFFSLDQRKRLQAANIQMVPVDFSSVEGIKDGARALEQAFASNPERSQRARAYQNTIDDIVVALAYTHDGAISGGMQHDGLITWPVSIYTSMPGEISYKKFDTSCHIATDAVTGASYAGGSGIDVSNVLLLYDRYQRNSPLCFWVQVAGAFNTSTQCYNSGRYDLTLLWPLQHDNFSASMLTGGGALQRWSGSRCWMGIDGYSSYFPSQSQNAGLGSKWQPYLIVCGSDGLSGTEVERRLEASMIESTEDGLTPTNPYSVLRYSINDLSGAHGGGAPGKGGMAITSTIGATNCTEVYSPFYKPTGALDVGDTVRVNPTGLLGDWTEGNMESVLEAVWLNDLYSRTAPGSDHVPIGNMDSFSVNIGGSNCTTTQQTVEAFYRYFYRLSDADANQCYQAVVTDTFAGLN